MKKLFQSAVAVATLITASALAPTARADINCSDTLTQVFQYKTGEVEVIGPSFHKYGQPLMGIFVCNVKTDGDVCTNMLSLLQGALLSGRKVSIIADWTNCSNITNDRPAVSKVIGL